MTGCKRRDGALAALQPHISRLNIADGDFKARTRRFYGKAVYGDRSRIKEPPRAVKRAIAVWSANGHISGGRANMARTPIS